MKITTLEGNIIAGIALILAIVFYFMRAKEFRPFVFLIVFGNFFLLVLFAYWLIILINI